VVDIGLRPARHDDPRRVNAVVALEVRSHDLVLHDVEIEMRRDGPLADGVVPRRDVAHDGHAKASRGGEIRHRDVRLEIGHDETVATDAHRLLQQLRDIPPAGIEPGRHRAVDGAPAR
jgi:hypothetical protein